jgi:hypothetical protein
MSLNNCPLCGREMIHGPSVDAHHLIPKSFKGTEVEDVHRICHIKIHSVFSEREMFKHYHTWERMLENDEIQKFVKWVSKKEPEYLDVSKDTHTRKSKRKRR